MLEFDRARRHEQAMEGEGGYGIGRALSWKDKCAGKSARRGSMEGEGQGGVADGHGSLSLGERRRAGGDPAHMSAREAC